MTRADMFVTAGISALTLGLGFFTGFRFARKQFEEVYADNLAIEIERTKEILTARYATEEFDFPRLMPEAIQDRPKIQVYDIETEFSSKTPIPPNIVQQLQEYAGSTAVVPKVADVDWVFPITEEAYSEEEEVDGRPWEKYALTYFTGDNVLMDEKGDVLNDKDARNAVGDLAARFNEVAEDVSTIFVRNTRLDMDFEILQDHSNYSEVIAGLARSEGADGV